MISAYKDFEINVEPVADGTAARARLIRNGSAVPYAILDDAPWVYGADCATALSLARFFVDRMEAQDSRRPHERSPEQNRSCDLRRKDASETNSRLPTPEPVPPHSYGETM